MSVKGDLVKLGWPTNQVSTNARLTRAIKNFQRGWARGTALKVDGIAGPATKSAIAASIKAGGKVGKTITWRQTASQGNGDIFPTRASVLACERTKSYMLATYGSFKIFSWCRDPAWNKQQGGSSRSRHLVGDAVDFAPHRSATEHRNRVQAWRRLEKRGDGLIWHGDMSTDGGGTPTKPVVFNF